MTSDLYPSERGKRKALVWAEGGARLRLAEEQLSAPPRLRISLALSSFLFFLPLCETNFILNT